MRKIPVIAFLISSLLLSAASAEKLSLSDSLGLAKKNSESLAISQAKLDQANALAGQAYSAFLPQLRLDASLGRAHVEQPPTGITKDFFYAGVPAEDTTIQFPPNESDSFAYSGTFNQNIFTWGRVYNGWRIANLGADIAREEYRSADSNLSYNVISAYYGVIRARKTLELANEGLDLANRHLGQAKVMFDSGVATKSDVLRAELESARSELSVSRAKRAVSVADNAFNMAIGANIDEPVDLNDADFKKSEMTAIKYEEFLEIARRSRPEWKIAKAGREIADMGKSIAYTGFLPMFFLTGTYGYNNVRNQEYDIDSQDMNWNVALVSSWTIFDGFATPYKVWDAYAKYTEAAKGEDLLNKKVAIEVKDAVLSLNSAVEELKSAKKAVELAEENYKIADMRYSSGIGTNLEAIDAKTMLTQARLDYLEAEFGYELAKAEVNKAVGEEVLK